LEHPTPNLSHAKKLAELMRERLGARAPGSPLSIRALELETWRELRENWREILHRPIAFDGRQKETGTKCS